MRRSFKWYEYLTLKYTSRFGLSLTMHPLYLLIWRHWCHWKTRAWNRKNLLELSFINSQYCVLYLHHVGLNRLLSPKDIIHELLFPFFSCRIHDSDGSRFSYYSPRLPLAPWKFLEILATLASSHENVFRQSLVRRKYRYERRTECFSLINRQFEEFSKKQGLVQLN